MRSEVISVRWHNIEAKENNKKIVDFRTFQKVASYDRLDSTFDGQSHVSPKSSFSIVMCSLVVV